MKFSRTETQTETRNPVAYLVQGQTQKYYAFRNKNCWHTLNEKGDGTVNYCSGEFEPNEPNTILETYYEGDTITIQL